MTAAVSARIAIDGPAEPSFANARVAGLPVDRLPLNAGAGGRRLAPARKDRPGQDSKDQQRSHGELLTSDSEPRFPRGWTVRFSPPAFLRVSLFREAQCRLQVDAGFSELGSEARDGPARLGFFGSWPAGDSSRRAISDVSAVASIGLTPSTEQRSTT